MTAPALQFGRADPGVAYLERHATFGILVRDGRIATVRVTRDVPYHDLPGGAVEGGETEEQALVREFREETGLTIRPLERLLDAGQYFRKSDGAPVNNFGGLWTVELVSHDPASKVEDDHELVWLAPDEALKSLRHDAHAWAVTAWTRRNRTRA